jgi:hypothetical protein
MAPPAHIEMHISRKWRAKFQLCLPRLSLAVATAITESHIERYRGIFQPPTADELALYDPPLPESN